MQKKKLKISALFAACGLLLPALPEQTNAACSRSDVDYYLEKGFSHEQIADICKGPVQNEQPLRQDSKDRTSAAPAPASEDVQPPKAAPQTRIQSKSKHPGSPEKLLVESIDGYDIDITGDSFSYARETCLKYGEEDLFGFQGQACPEVLYTIDLEGLKVLNSEKEYLFFGDERVKVEGRISRRITGGVEELPADERELITEMLQEDGDQLIIPIREGVPAYRVIDSLEKLSK